ncbi:MAG: hypothetical protein HYR94_29175 [Chloroflexi bacterium]|nr:hypothetical protein [Chloroflexota bacterium]
MLLVEEQKKIASLINAIIDIPLVSEEMEQVIFEHAVAIIDAALDDILPEVFGGLLRDADKGIDKDHAREFARRLAEAVNKRVNLPYLNEEQEGRMIQTVIDPIVKAMIDGKRLEAVLPAYTQAQS